MRVRGFVGEMAETFEGPVRQARAKPGKNDDQGYNIITYPTPLPRHIIALRGNTAVLLTWMAASYN